MKWKLEFHLYMHGLYIFFCQFVKIYPLIDKKKKNPLLDEQEINDDMLGREPLRLSLTRLGHATTTNQIRQNSIIKKIVVKRVNFIKKK